MVLPVRRIVAEIDAPGVIELKPNQKTARVTIRATLRNVSDDTVVLHAPSADHRHFWHIFDESAQEVCREHGRGKGGQRRANPRSFRSATIGPRQERHETRTIALDTGALTDGGRYVLRAEIWGQTADTEFVAVLRPAPVAKRKTAKTKASAKKKPAKKAAKKKAAKTSARKRTVKKAARRKASKRVTKSTRKKRPTKKK